MIACSGTSRTGESRIGKFVVVFIHTRARIEQPINSLISHSRPDNSYRRRAHAEYYNNYYCTAIRRSEPDARLRGG